LGVSTDNLLTSSERIEESSNNLLASSHRLEWATWILVLLTAALIGLTITLIARTT
jgi:hypothetical protein